MILSQKRKKEKNKSKSSVVLFVVVVVFFVCLSVCFCFETGSNYVALAGPKSILKLRACMRERGEESVYHQHMHVNLRRGL